MDYRIGNCPTHLEPALAQLGEILPHDSGIDCDWTLEIKGTRIIASNSYHAMGENGYYCGYADFTVTFPLTSQDPANDFRLTFAGDNQSQYLARRYDLREYLADTIHYALREAYKQ